MTSSGSEIKSTPLNMMIMTEGCEDQFTLMKEQLELCVGANQYTIYPLSSANYTLPWQSGCRAVFIPANVCTKRWNTLDDFISHGGCIVSFNSQWNQLNGFPYPSGLTASSLTNVRLLNSDDSRCIDPFHVLTIPDGTTDQEGIVTNDDDDDRVVLTEAISDEESGIAVVINVGTVKIMSYIDLISPYSNITSNTKILASLKEGVLPRRCALRWLLTKAGIKCSEISQPPLSLCYLTASNKVCFYSLHMLTNIAAVDRSLKPLIFKITH